jgi:hypothetical protein
MPFSSALDPEQAIAVVIEQKSDKLALRQIKPYRR